MPTILDFFSKYKPVPLNPIQIAQNSFLADTRTTDPSLPPAQRKHSLAQGLLLNNKPREDKDFQGNPINQKAGQLFQMASVIEAKRLFFETCVKSSDDDKYANPKDKILLGLEPLVQRVVFGNDSENGNLISSKRIATIPLPGMAQSFTTIAAIIRQEYPDFDTVLFGSNGYEGYKTAFKDFFPNTKTYRHATPDDKFDLESFTKTIETLEHPERTLLLLQADSYNYTGVNPTTEQKKQIIETIKRFNILTLIDSAYQGLTRGLTEDTEIIRMLAKENVPFIVYDSYSKKTQLYGWRTAFVHFVTANEEQAKIMRANLYSLIRNRYLSIAPTFKIVYHLLSNEALKKHWEEFDVPAARDILVSTKTTLSSQLQDGFEFVSPSQTQGMFNKLNITHEGGQILANKYGIFAVNLHDEDARDAQGNLKQTLRVNMGGIPLDSLEYIAESFKEVYRTHKSL